MRFSCLVLTGAVLALGVGCSSKTNPGPSGTGGGGSVSYTNNGPGVCAGTTRPINDAFCNGKCVAQPACTTSKNRPIDSCCTLVGEPGQSSASQFLERTTDTKEYADPTGAPPNLGCFDPAGYPAKPPAPGSKTVTLTGELRPFANGGCGQTDLDGVSIEIYSVKRTGDPATDGALDQKQGSGLVVDASMPAIKENVTNKCVDGFRYNRQFSYPNVPMYTELVIKTYGNGWTPLYTYNVYVGDSDPDYNAGAGTYTYNVRALASDDFNTIPTAAIGKTITTGNGAVGGEVHDCDNIRLQNARMDISIPRYSISYFNSSEDNPLPDGNAVSTGKTALYTGLDIQVSGPEGSYARIAGTGLLPDGDGAKLVSVGYFDVRVYPDSVTSLSVRGLRPFQVP